MINEEALAKYGVLETNPIGGDYHKVDRSVQVGWNDPRLAQVTRLRLITDPGYPLWDVSYCHGILKDGTEVTVVLPFRDLPKKGTVAAIISYAKEDGVYAKGLGILDNISRLY